MGAWLDALGRCHIDAHIVMPEDNWPDDLLASLLRLHRQDRTR